MLLSVFRFVDSQCSGFFWSARQSCLCAWMWAFFTTLFHEHNCQAVSGYLRHVCDPYVYSEFKRTEILPWFLRLLTDYDARHLKSYTQPSISWQSVYVDTDPQLCGRRDSGVSTQFLQQTNQTAKKKYALCPFIYTMFWKPVVHFCTWITQLVGFKYWQFHTIQDTVDV